MASSPVSPVRIRMNENLEKADFKHGKGCFSCMHTGFKGRTGIYEVLIIDDFVQDLILKRSSAHEITRLLKERHDFTTLKDSAAQKVIQGITSLEEAASAVMV